MGNSAEDIRIRKGHLRSRMRSELSKLASERSVPDAGVTANILEVIRQRCSVVAVGGYMAIGQEPDVSAVIDWSLSSGIQVYLPRYISVLNAYEMVRIRDVRADVSRGRYGILEPVSFLPGSDISAWSASGGLWLVPGLAFDCRGYRLGRGMGYYDRLLQSAGGVKVGVGYECQLVEAVPSEVHDIPMDYVVTESRILAMY